MKTKFQVSDEYEIIKGDYGDDEEIYEVEAYDASEAAREFVTGMYGELEDGQRIECFVQELNKPETRVVIEVTTYIDVRYKTKVKGKSR